ncbi:MAG: hypothetical protein GX542_09040 [Rhodococcus sp.]|nr:hypothetical protein [Rhodococcus sp. (in: high G+C Gram-positive bacteria)]
MSTELPALDPVLAASIAALPARLVQRATKLLAQRPEWQVSSSGESTLVVIGKATVTVSSPQDVSCDCLLAPECAHRAAVISASPVAESVAEVAADHTVAAEVAVSDSDAYLNESQCSAMEFAISTVAAVVSIGLGELTVAERTRLMQAVHLARNAGLHRLAGALTAMYGTPSSDTLRDAALAVHELQRAHREGSVTAHEIGVARRAFTVTTGLRLHGVCCEPVLTGSGYAGVVTTLVDDEGRTYSVNTVRPGAADDVPTAYQTPAGLGDLLATHAQLGRGQLLLTSATVSAEGRLGTGRSVRASMSSKPAEPPRLPEGISDVTGTVNGVRPQGDTAALVVTTESGSIRSFTPTAAATELGALRLLRVVAARPGTTVRLRVRAGEILALTLPDSEEPDSEEGLFPGLDQPPASSGRAVLADSGEAAEAMYAAITPDEILGRWALRAATAGRRLVRRSIGAIDDDVRWLGEHGSPHRAELLSRLREVGYSQSASDAEFATAWLAVALAGSLQ